MEDNKNEKFGDFFTQKDKAKEEPKAERPTYYYSYGPYNSSMGDSKEDEQPSTHTTSISSSGEQSNVEVAAPRMIRPLGLSTSSTKQTTAEWQVQKKKSPFRSVFAAFMAGAIVVGGLMFAADKTNLFTGDGAVFAGASNGAAPSTNGSNNSGVVNTSLDIGRPTNISEMVQNASPAVVKIETFVKPKANQGRSQLDPLLRQFFGDSYGQTQPQQNGGTEQRQSAGMGTGFIFEKSGYILTNEHVVNGADEIEVTIQGYDKPFKAKLLGNSYDLDLAALKIEGDNFPTLPIGSADNLKQGDWVVAIGNPYGFDHTVTVGVLSAKERPISIPDTQGTRNYKHLLQTDASINPGNSGGPLLNLNGEVIGINTAVNSQAQGIGFAIPASTFSAVLDNLKNNITIPKEPIPYIGVVLGNVDKDLATELKLSSTEGALVTEVERKSPAFKAGLRPYDVIVDMNGTKITKYEDLVTKVRTTKVGDKVTLGVMREGKKVDVTVVVEDRNTVTTTTPTTPKQ